MKVRGQTQIEMQQGLVTEHNIGGKREETEQRKRLPAGKGGAQCCVSSMASGEGTNWEVSRETIGVYSFSISEVNNFFGHTGGSRMEASRRQS